MNGGMNGVSNGGMGSGPNGATATATLTASAPTQQQERMERVSPLARRLAQEHHLDLNMIRGTGEAGRIRKEDIEAYLQQQSQTATATLPPAPVPVADAASTAHPRHDRHTAASARRATCSACYGQRRGPDHHANPARRAIAEHMVRSKHTSPHAWTAIEVDMTNVARWLDSYKDEFKRREGFGISFQTSVIQGGGRGAQGSSVPQRLVDRRRQDRAAQAGQHRRLHRAGEQPDRAGDPQRRHAQPRRHRPRRQRSGDARPRQPAMPADLQGATFTVNNPGVFGTVLSAAIINQPNAAILTMDTVVKRPVVINDGIAIRSMMFLSLSFDHRVLDGLQAARFLAALKQRLETWSPETSAY